MGKANEKHLHRAVDANKNTVEKAGNSASRNFISVMVLVTLMVAGSYIATMNQSKDVSAVLPVERVPLGTADQPGAADGSAMPNATTGSAISSAAEGSASPETVKTSGFFAYRNTLADTRSSAAVLLDEVIADAAASAETVQQALQRKAELADAMAMETEIETLLKARGFADALCTINPQSVNIVVLSEGLTQRQASQIMDIAVSVTGQPASNIRIIPSE